MTAVYVIYLAVFNYLADGKDAQIHFMFDLLLGLLTRHCLTFLCCAAYLVYASSALAGQSFARNMFGFAFPLFAEQMYVIDRRSSRAWSYKDV